MELNKPEDLMAAQVLGTATRPAAWSEWLAAIGRSDIDLRTHESYEHFYLLIQAASYGLGMALAPFGFVPGPHELNLWIAPHVRSRDDVRRLSNWIQAEMALQDPLREMQLAKTW